MRLLFTFLLLSSQLWAGSEFVKHEKWSTYLQVIGFYHRFYPGVYQAIELLPLEKIPTASLMQEISKQSLDWETLQKKKRGTLADRQKEIQFSRNANEQLVSLIPIGEQSFVVNKNVINSIPAEQRLALTPLDPVFWNSVIGKKAKSDLSKLKSDMTQVEEVRIRSEKGILDFSLKDSGQKYRIRVLEKGEDVLRVKGSVSQNRELSSTLAQDSELKVYDLKGAFYQKKEDKLPFGPYPPPQELYIGEDGNTHFKGDGHKHFY